MFDRPDLPAAIVVAYTTSTNKQKPFWLIFKTLSFSFSLEKAYRAGIYGRKYQWVIAGEYSEYWWTKSEKFEKSGNCSTKEILKAIEGYILIDVLPLSSSNIMTASGMVSRNFLIIKKNIRQSNQRYIYAQRSNQWSRQRPTISSRTLGETNWLESEPEIFRARKLEFFASLWSRKYFQNIEKYPASRKADRPPTPCQSSIERTDSKSQRPPRPSVSKQWKPLFHDSPVCVRSTEILKRKNTDNLLTLAITITGNR